MIDAEHSAHVQAVKEFLREVGTAPVIPFRPTTKQVADYERKHAMFLANLKAWLAKQA